jgi:phosphoglycolate phosphatase-like HAD superfamily hydrolase
MILFDIDGTLIRGAGPHHRQALVTAVRGVMGIETSTDNIPVQGMLDRDILAIMLRNAGAKDTDIRRAMPHLVRRAQWVYARACADDLRDKVCPGVVDVLRALRKRDIPAGIVSGNLSNIGWKKMERARLSRFFRFGSFAEKGETRADLVRIAVKDARQLRMIRHGARISLVGDHPNDVTAAKTNGIRAIAVATGLSSREELLAAGPDILLDDLRGFDLERLL